MRTAAICGLVGIAAVLGLWSLAAPASLATDLGLTVAWVASDGPYNEHLVPLVDAVAQMVSLTLVVVLALELVAGAAPRRRRP